MLVCKGTPRAICVVTIAHDGLAGARDAVRYVAGLPLPAHTRLRLVGVAEPVRYSSTAPGILRATLRAAVARVEDERRRILEAALRPEAAELRARVSSVDVRVTVGLPTPEILRNADATETDLLVVGARGLGTMKRLLLGSVSETVLRHASCPVLIVRRRA